MTRFWQAESEWLERAVGLASDARQKLVLEMAELDGAIGQLEALLAQGCEANPDLKMSKEEVEAMVRATRTPSPTRTRT